MATYKVGEKVSFVHAGRSYKTGDEINSKIFSEKALAAAIKGKKLVEIDAPPSASAGGSKSLEDMTKAELLAYAQKKGITASGNKDEILAAIKAAGKPGPKNLEAITDEELLAYAADHEIDVTGANREEILAEIKAAEGND